VALSYFYCAGNAPSCSQFLSRSFFEKHQEYTDYRSKITEHGTPGLFLELEIAELNRVDLLQEVGAFASAD
jgi:hypothetical protein